MMTAQISFFCRQTVGNKKEGSRINATLKCVKLMEKHPLPPKVSSCAPAFESGFLRQGVTFFNYCTILFISGRTNCFQN